MGKATVLNPAGPPDGSEKLVVIQGAGTAARPVLMPAGDLAAAGTKPSPAELQAAVLDTLVDGAGISFTDNGDGTLTIEVDAADLVTAAELAGGLATKQAASAILSALAGLAVAGHAGQVIKVNPAGDGFVLGDDLQGAGGGSTALADGTYGDVVVSGGGTVFTVVVATDEAYGAGWNNDKGPATKNAVFAKIEALAVTIAGKVAATSVGQANGVAGLDATGKVPAAQLPSYIDDVLEFASTAAFPNPGETGKIYVALDTNKQYRWSGSAYQELTASPGTTDNVPEGAGNKYYTDVRVRASVMTGLIDTVGAPADTDSLLTILGKLKRQAFTVIPAGFASLSAAENIFTGIGRFATPNTGTVGGVRVTGNAVSGYGILQFLNSDASAQWGYLRCQADGTLYYSGALTVQGNITYLSDRRLKENIRPLDSVEAEAAALALQAVRYEKDGREQIGFIAQDVERVLPEAVLTAEGGEQLKSLDLGPIVAVLVEQVKYLSAEVERLKAAA
jgi:hypothetical protein